MPGRPVRIDVRQLRPGLYISLGERWLDHRFLFNSFRLSNETQIARIRQAGFTHVDYHPGRSSATPLPLPSATAVTAPPAAPAAPAAEREQQRRRAERLASRRTALATCERAYRRSVAAVKALMAEVFVAPREAGVKADGLVADIVADLLANRHAVINLMSGLPSEAGARYHALNVMILSLLLGRTVGLQGEALRLVGLGALLHDIGKVHLPPALLRLDPAERTRHQEAAYRQHVEYGTMQCLELGFDQAAVLHVVRHHHERMDGSGWPDRLHGLHIPLPTRIVAIANRFDGLCHAPDPHRSMTPSEALAHMYRHEAAALDRSLLQRFIKCLGIWPPGTLVQLSNGVTGLVTAVESDDTLRPTVLVGDLSVPRARAVIADLREAPGVKVERALRPADVDGAVLAYLAPRTYGNYFIGAGLPAA